MFDGEEFWNDGGFQGNGNQHASTEERDGMEPKKMREAYPYEGAVRADQLRWCGQAVLPRVLSLLPHVL